MRRCILDEASHRWMTLTSHAGHKMRSVIQNCIINDSYIYADAHIESTISRRHGTLCPQISRYVKVACNVSNVTTTIKQRYCQYGRFAEHELLAGTLLIFYLGFERSSINNSHSHSLVDTDGHQTYKPLRYYEVNGSYADQQVNSTRSRYDDTVLRL